MTGTDGGSNLTFPVFWLLASAIPLSDAFDVPERLSPPRPFHSASSESGAVEFASIQWNRQIKSPRQNNKTIILFQICLPLNATQLQALTIANNQKWLPIICGSLALDLKNYNRIRNGFDDNNNGWFSSKGALINDTYILSVTVFYIISVSFENLFFSFIKYFVSDDVCTFCCCV